jgi:hypothetical protein
MASFSSTDIRPAPLNRHRGVLCRRKVIAWQGFCQGRDGFQFQGELNKRGGHIVRYYISGKEDICLIWSGTEKIPISAAFPIGLALAQSCRGDTMKRRKVRKRSPLLAIASKWRAVVPQIAVELSSVRELVSLLLAEWHSLYASSGKRYFSTIIVKCSMMVMWTSVRSRFVFSKRL